MTGRAAAACVVCAAALPLVACGNYVNVEVDGWAGVSHDAEGDIALHVITCDNATSRVMVHAGREGLEGSEVNPTIGAYTLDEPASGVIEIDVDAPAPWVAEQPLVLPDDPSHLFIVGAELENRGGPSFIRPERYVSDASVTYDELMALPDDEIATGHEYDPDAADGLGELETVSPGEFAALCDRKH